MTVKEPPTVLLCDAAFSAVPILLALQRAGFRVAVCGSRANDPGHGLADLSLVMDYRDRETLLRTVSNEGVRFVVPGCTDVSYLSCAWIAAQLHLPGFDTPEAADIIHKKDKFRRFCRTHRFATPRSTSSISEVSGLTFPILVKPSDSFSGKGIVKVERREGLLEGVALSKAQTGAEALVFEEFVEGNLYSHSAFIQNGKIHTDFFVNEYCTVHPYQVNSSHLSADLGDNIIGGLREWLEAFASMLNLASGLVHTQFISDGERFYLIEVMRRCPGDLYAVLIEKSTGINHAGLYAAAFCGSDLPIQRSTRLKRWFSRHTVSVDRDCIFISSAINLSHAEAAFVPLKKTGEPLRAAPLDRAGIYFVQHSSDTRMKAFAPRWRDFVTVETLGDA
jgi:biotin carboxylase